MNVNSALFWLRSEIMCDWKWGTDLIIWPWCVAIWLLKQIEYTHALKQGTQCSPLHQQPVLKTHKSYVICDKKCTRSHSNSHQTYIPNKIWHHMTWFYIAWINSWWIYDKDIYWRYTHFRKKCTLFWVNRKLIQLALVAFPQESRKCIIWNKNRINILVFNCTVIFYMIKFNTVFWQTLCEDKTHQTH